jgi:hypothetical protein
MIKKVVFYNHWHNGDVHIGRSFVREIMYAMMDMENDTVFTYAHKNPSNLLADIPGLGYDPKPLTKLSPYDGTRIHGDTAYINTWYCQDQNRYFRQTGLTFDSLYAAMNDACKKIWKSELAMLGKTCWIGDLKLEGTPRRTENFFPSIDYAKFEIDKAKTWLAEHSGKKVLVENGSAMSKQADNFPMAPAICDIANNHPNTIFILTTKDTGWYDASNVVFSDDIIQKTNKSDLNEVSFLSTHCDMVIGRSSGVFTFCLTKENLFEREMKFLSFAKPIVAAKPDKYWLGKRFENELVYKAQTKVSHETEPGKVMKEIEEWL